MWRISHSGKKRGDILHSYWPENVARNTHYTDSTDVKQVYPDVWQGLTLSFSQTSNLGTTSIAQGKFAVTAQPRNGLFVAAPTCTANDGPVRIQYVWLVPIYVCPEIKLLFPKQNYNVLSPMHSYICERFIYFQDRAYSAAMKYVDRSWEYINCSQTH